MVLGVRLLCSTGMPAHFHFVPSTLAAVEESRMPSPLFRRQPTVPSARVRGHVPIFALASFQAAHSHLVPSEAASGGGWSSRGGYAAP